MDSTKSLAQRAGLLYLLAVCRPCAGVFGRAFRTRDALAVGVFAKQDVGRMMRTIGAILGLGVQMIEDW
jgi:hypothetical protein